MTNSSGPDCFVGYVIERVWRWSIFMVLRLHALHEMTDINEKNSKQHINMKLCETIFVREYVVGLNE